MKFFKRYEETCTIARRAGSGGPTKIMGEVKQLVEKQMRADDETTEEVLIANLFVVPTRKKGLIGCAVTFTRHPLVFKTLFGPTNALYS